MVTGRPSAKAHVATPTSAPEASITGLPDASSGQARFQLEEGEGLIEHLHRVDARLHQPQHAPAGWEEDEQRVSLARVDPAVEPERLQPVHGQLQHGQVPFVQGDHPLHLQQLIVGEQDVDFVGASHHMQVGDELAPGTGDAADPLAAGHFEDGECWGCSGGDRPSG